MPARRSLNKVMLIGNLTRDAEVNYTASGTPVCGFTVATNRAWKNANGEMHEEATFHRVSAWGKFYENLAKYLTKGLQVYIEGFLTYRENRDDSGKLVSKDARIQADVVTILDRAGKPAAHDDMAATPGEPESKGNDGEFDLDAIAQGLEEAKPSSSAAKNAPVADDDLPF